MKRPGDHSPSHETVRKQLAAVARNWDALTGQLNDRCGRIDQAIVKSTEYQSRLRKLSEKLSALDDKLSSSLAVSTDPDAVKQQLEAAREVKQEIEQEMPNINAVQSLCEELAVLVSEDYLKAELMRQLDGVLKPFKDLEQKVGECQSEKGKIQKYNSGETILYTSCLALKSRPDYLQGKRAVAKRN